MALALVAACGGRVSPADETDDETDEGTTGESIDDALPTPIDPAAWCTPTPAPDLRVLAHEHGELGLCGHFLAADGASELIAPDGTSVPVPGPVWNPYFSPTGHLAAWRLEPEGDVVRLYDLRSGETRDISTSSSSWHHWFTRSASQDIGAWLSIPSEDGWGFHSLTQSVELPTGPHARELALGRARVVSAMDDGTIMLADADADRSWPVATGFQHDIDVSDRLDLDVLGRVVFHHVIGYRVDPGEAGYEQVETRVYADDGTLLATYEPGVQILQQQRPDAPLYLSNDSLRVVEHGEDGPRLHTLADSSVHRWALGDDGSLLASILEFGSARVLLSRAATPTEPLELGSYRRVDNLVLSRDARSAAWLEITTDCINDACSHATAYIHRWSASRGHAEPIVSAYDTDYVVASFDDGTALVHAAPVTGPTDAADIPTHQWLLIDLDGQTRAAFDGEFTLFAEPGQRLWLPDGRLLTTIDDGVSSPTMLFEIDALAGTFVPFGPAPSSYARLDGFGERIAMMTFDGTTLWGAIPD